MAYVIIAVVLLLIIVPIFSVLPSARQREQMAMRNAARAEGVTVELTSIADPNPKQDKYISHIGKPIDPVLKVAAYRVQRRRSSNWRLLPQVNWRFSRDLEGNWHPQQSASEHISDDLAAWLPEQVVQLPADVEQVEEMNYNIIVYWHERRPGDEKKVFEFLKQCAGLPLHKPLEDD